MEMSAISLLTQFFSILNQHALWIAVVLIPCLSWLLINFSHKRSTKLLNNELQLLFEQRQQHADQQFIVMQERLRQLENMREQLFQALQQQQHSINEQRLAFSKHQLENLTSIQNSLQKNISDIRDQTNSALMQHANLLSKHVERLTEQTQTHLRNISEQVDKQLTKGFEKTTATFNDVVKRLTIIDQAQQKITELSSNVVSLQEILSDKKSRGTFGEVQLNALIQDMIPAQHYSLQHTLSNGKRVDCLLFLPEPTGHIAIDAKFPLESYQRLQSNQQTESTNKLQTQFRTDIKVHIQAIASKYIIEGETADGAVMFIPAETIFAEIHAYYPDIVEYALQQRVWLASPTTMMAILTTARAVLKDAATRKQVHIIQKHLVALSKDFERFERRMDDLARHINQAHQDVEKVHSSSKKISSRFEKIEKVELLEDGVEELEDQTTE